MDSFRPPKRPPAAPGRPALLALALAGCGTEPITDAQGTRARAILDPSMTSEAATRGVLVVRRDRSFERSGCDHRMVTVRTVIIGEKTTC
jgi:hypothetical protein